MRDHRREAIALNIGKLQLRRAVGMGHLYIHFDEETGESWLDEQLLAEYLKRREAKAKLLQVHINGLTALTPEEHDTIHGGHDDNSASV